MSSSFDFDKYKAIVDYISNASGTITTSIDDLISGLVEMRRNSTASIVKYNTDYKTVSIGVIHGDISDDTFYADADITATLHDGVSVSSADGSSKYSDEALPLKTDISTLVTTLSDYYIPKNASTLNITTRYDIGVTSFSGQDIPSVKFFKDNYYTNGNETLSTKLIASSDIDGSPKTAVSKSIAQKYSGIDTSSKKAFLRGDGFSSNVVSVSSDGLSSIHSNIQSFTIGAFVSILDAPSEKSVITQDNISKVCIKKDLSNMPAIPIENGDVSNQETVATVDNLVEKLNNGEQFDSSIVSIDKTCKPSYSPKTMSTDMLDDGKTKDALNQIKEIEDMLRTESMTTGDTELLKQNIIYLTSISPDVNGVPSADFSKINGKTALSLKLIYELVAARLKLENKNLFMTEIEHFNMTQSSHIYMGSTDTVFYMRPLVKNTTSSIGTIDDIEKMNIKTESSGAFIGAW